MQRRLTTLDRRTVRKRKRNNNVGSVKNAKTRYQKRLRTEKMIKTKRERKEKKAVRMKKLNLSNPIHQRAIIHPYIEGRVLVIWKDPLDLIFEGKKKLELRGWRWNKLQKGDILFLQERGMKDLIRGYVRFQGNLFIKDEDHFQQLIHLHQWTQSSMKDAPFSIKWGFKLSSPHEYETPIRCRITGQNTKIIREIL